MLLEIILAIQDSITFKTVLPAIAYVIGSSIVLLLKIFLNEANNAQHKFDIMYISETYLKSSFPDEDRRLHLPGYIVVRADNPNITKRGSVCVYFKELLVVRLVTPPF